MKKIWIFAIKIAIAFLIISYLIHVHYDSFAEGIKNFNATYLLPAVLILFLEMTFCAFRWFMLVRMIDIKITLREAISLTMRGYFCSLVLFGGAIGGDMAKIGMIAHGLPPGKRFECSLSILIDRIIGMIALFLTAIILIFADMKTLRKIDLASIGISQEYNNYVIAAVLTVCFAGILTAALIFAHQLPEKVPFFKFLTEKADKLTNGLVNRIKFAIVLYTNQWKNLLFLTFGSIFLVHLIQMPILYCICCGLNMEVPSLLTLTTAIIIGNIAGLVPLTPGGIGLRDLVIFTVLQAGAFNNATSVVILLSLVLIIGNISAGIFFFDKGLCRDAEEKQMI